MTQYSLVKEDNMDSIKLSALGTLYVNELHDDGSKTLVLEKNNAVHLGNLSTILAEAALGKETSFISYMAFGNAGVDVETNGIINYKNPNVSGFNNPNERLYNTVLIRRVRNYASLSDVLDVQTSNFNTNYEDIVVQVILNDVDGEEDLDRETEVTDFVFNEIALYAGRVETTPIRDGNLLIRSSSEIEEFLNDTAGVRPIMLTHVVFHPVQKSRNRVLEITYKLRLVLG